MNNKLKPIEAGCLAMVIGFRARVKSNNGKIVKVIERLGVNSSVGTDRNMHKSMGVCWSIDTPLLYHLVEGDGTGTELHAIGAEKHLMRIDPDDDQKKGFEKEKRQMDRVIKQHVPVFIPSEIQK